MKKAQWHMNRLGLVDFWYYVNEEFYFKDGHMLLRGSNGSGKSVTMQSFIPLLLDGNKSSERLDSFGTKSRRIENYLLEEDSDRDDRIGYLYLEFKKEDVEMYKTIGMGLHARRNKQLDAWYFVIEDNRRINKDLFLMENHLAITKTALKNRIGDQYIDSQREYMEHVNKSLFGFPSRDEYKEAINLLMQVRSPKLSNSLKPTMIHDILSNSLQPLSEDDLRPMSEAISSMDEIEEQLFLLRQSYDSAKSIVQIYDQYNSLQLEKKLNAYMKAKDEYEKNETEIKRANKEISDTEIKQKNGKEKLELLMNEDRILKEERNVLNQKNFDGHLNRINDLKREISNDEHNKEKKEEQKDQKRDICNRAKENMEKADGQKNDHYLQLEEYYHDLEKINDNIQFTEHIALKQEVMLHPEKEYDYTYTRSCIQQEIRDLEEGIELFKEKNKSNELKDALIDQKEEQLQNQEKAEREYEKLVQLLNEKIDDQQEAFHKWYEQNQVLIMSKDKMMNINDALRRYDIEDSYLYIEKLITDSYNQVFKNLIEDKYKYQSMNQQLEKELNEAQCEFEKWRNMEDPVPEIDEAMKENRQFLQDRRISYQPLYTLLEFGDEISENTKNQIEEVFMRSHLLNALVVEEKYRFEVLTHRKGMADTYLFTTKNLSALKPYWIHDADKDLNEFFSAIGVDISNTKFNHFTYQSGDITGTISESYLSCFIGKNTREKYRQEKINAYECLINDLLSRQKDVLHKIDEADISLDILEKEYHSYPPKDELDSIKQKITNNEKEIETIVRSIQKFEDDINKCQNEIIMIQHHISELADHLGINALQDVFEARKKDFKEYEMLLQEFITRHLHYIHQYELYISYCSQCESAENDLLAIQGEISALKFSIQKNCQLLDVLKKQLKDSGFEETMKRLDEIEMRLKEIEELKANENQMLGKMSEKLQNDKENLSKLYIIRSEKEMIEQKAYQRYKQEASLGYVLTDISFEQISEAHKYLNEKNASIKKKDLSIDLQNVFYTNRGNLQEYNLGIINLFEEDEEAKRLDIHARYHGTKISFSELVEKLNDNIQIQNNLLAESDRHLIEDVLINTISKKIKHHIQKSEAWVKNMNRYMSEMNTSSGLKLGLQWKSHKAENEDELNSEKLVALLSKDVHILKDSDYKALSTHFRSKISTARKLSQQEDSNESLHTVMKKVLDYRNWFDFRILYEKKGERKKEMTNNAFYSFSGGEKAMSMYVPLFSAVAAKFENAREDAPVLIALDEAFAGMDDKNISNMFDLIAKFKFDYIMNSQVLWGDYPNVKGLAIHELFRPENAKYVSVITYEWNGYKKRLVNI